MVFYFTCSDPRYTIYMGRDKHENEHLIAYGWPEDIWFHVDKMSSAHVYLRLPPGDTIADVPHDIVIECAQLTKLNSIQGCKENNVTIIYTMWANLLKTGDMATGSVTFHARQAVKSVVIERRVNEIVNRLNRSKLEAHNNPSELWQLRQDRDKTEIKERQAAHKQAARQKALEMDAERLRLGELDASKRETVYGYEAVDQAALDDAVRQEEAKIKASLRKKKKGKVEVRTMEDDLVGDMFGDLAAPEPAPATSAAKGGGGDDDWLQGAAVGGDWGDDDDGGGGAVIGLESGGGAATVAELNAQRELLFSTETTAEMENLVKVAHARKAEAEVKHAQKQEEKRAKAAARAEAEGRARGEAPARRAAAADKAAAALGAAREGVEAARADGSLAASVEENVGQLQQDELMVLQAIFGDDDCVVEEQGGEGVDAPPSVRVAVNGTTRHKVDERVELRCVFPPEYPSHLPPRTEVLAGVADPDDRQYVCDQLAQLFLDSSVGTCCVHAYAEWLRDEWIPRKDAPKPAAEAE